MLQNLQSSELQIFFPHFFEGSGFLVELYSFAVWFASKSIQSYPPEMLHLFWHREVFLSVWKQNNFNDLQS